MQKKFEIMSAEGITPAAVCRQEFSAHGGNQKCSGIIIGAVAMGAIGNGIGCMLHDAGIIGKGFQVIQFGLFASGLFLIFPNRLRFVLFLLTFFLWRQLAFFLVFASADILFSLISHLISPFSKKPVIQ